MEATAQKKRKGVIESFLIGAKKGVNIFLNSMVPSIIMAYTIIYILQTTGVMDLLAKFLGPVMAIFGLPPEAVLCLATVALSRSGGCAVLAAFVADGTFTPEQCTYFVPAMVLFGGIVGQLMRTLAVCGTSASRQKFIIAATFITGFLSIFVSRILF